MASSTEYSIVALDLHGTIVLWNQGACALYGHTAADVVGHSSDVVIARALLERARASSPWSGVLQQARNDGTALTAFVTVTLRCDAAGAACGFTMISRELVDPERAFAVPYRRRRQPTFTRGLFESSIDALTTADTLGVITDVNQQMCTLTGRTRTELIGTQFKDHFNDPRRAEAGILRVLAEGRANSYELAMRGDRVVACTVTASRGTDGSLRGVFIAARDITEQKRLDQQIRDQNRKLAESTAFTNSVLESSTQHSIIAEDLDGTILAWNEGARRSYGYFAEEMIGKQSFQILHVPEDVSSGRVDALIDVAREVGEAEGVFEQVRKDGRRFTASIAVTSRRDAAGVPVGYVMIATDITEERELERQLRRNEELEQENIRVAAATRQKSEFLANMSHELRTPLNGIIGLAELMHDGKVGRVSSEHKEYLHDILTSSSHLLKLINDVLDLAKVESGKIEFRPETVDLERVIGEVRDILRTLSATKRLRVDCEIDPRVEQIVADPARLKQVLYNYLSNALKFTGEGGHIVVRAVPEGLHELRIEVADTGIGIRPEDFSQLFVEFHQLDRGSRKKYPGTGLGLALTRRIVEAQGGRVGVTSTVGKGTTFFAVLPRIAMRGKHGA